MEGIFPTFREMRSGNSFDEWGPKDEDNHRYLFPHLTIQYESRRIYSSIDLERAPFRYGLPRRYNEHLLESNIITSTVDENGKLTKANITAFRIYSL